MKKTILFLMGFLFIMTGCKNTTNSRMKGFMIDAARDVEKMEYYYRLVDFYSEKGFNTMMFRLTDDEGCAMRFTSHPELITHPGAYSKEEIKKFIEYAKSKNIEIIPEVESFGHTKYITKVERYHFLNDAPQDSTAIAWKNALCPVSDTTLMIMKDLYTEIAELFPSPYLHIGCDEIQWGAGELSKEALKTRTKNQIWSDYVNTLNGYVKSLGKKAIIWGDVILNEEQELQDMLNKDIVIVDWNYWNSNDQITDSIARGLIGKGFQIIGSPAANWFLWGPRVGAYQLENLLCFGRVYKKLQDPNNLGIIVTHWLPKRYVQNCQWDTYELVADIINNPETFSKENSLKNFTERHYGAAWNATWDAMYKLVYLHAPKHFYAGEALHPGFKVTPICPWTNEEELSKFIIKRNNALENPYPQMIRMAKELQPSVTKNVNDYNEFLLTLEMINHLLDRDSMMWNLSHSKTSKEQIAKTLKHWSEKDFTWVARLDSAWQLGRTAPLDSGHVWSFPKSAQFTKRLAEKPEILIQLLSKK